MIPYNISLDRKTGFRNKMPNRPVIIFDERGVPFYDSRIVDNFVYEFNMPSGNYIVGDGRIEPMQLPVDYSHLMLPLPEPVRKRKNPANFPIYICNNPFKCSVDWKNEEILLDRNLVDHPLPELRRILEHENAHRYYGTKSSDPQLKDYYEKCCDRYAHNKMLEDGYNPSQIGFSMIGSLSDRNQHREEQLLQDMIDVNSLSDYDHYEGDDRDYNDTGNVPASMIGKLFKSTKPITANSKPPFYIFPLLNNTKDYPTGTFLGSVLDSDSKGGNIWLKFSSISPSWIPYDKSGLIISGDVLKKEPSEKVKDEIIKQIPGGTEVVATKNVGKGIHDFTENTVNLVGFIGKNLTLLVILLIVLIIKFK